MTDITVNPINNDVDNIVLHITPKEMKFDFITSECEREMLETAYQAVTKLKLWEYLELHSGSFMFSSSPKIDRIYQKIEDLGYYGHSGASFGWTLQNLKYIADYGIDEFKKQYLKNETN